MGDAKLNQAVALQKKAQELEASGDVKAAFQEYKQCLQVFQFIYKWEKNAKVQEMVYERMEEIIPRAEALKQILESPPMQGCGGSTAAATIARPPPRAGGGTSASGGGAPFQLGGGSDVGGAEDDKEVSVLRKGLEGAIITTKPDIHWDDVAGLEAAKEALQETVILPTQFPKLFTGKRQPWRGILMYGPPGTGKSYLAKACATEADATFFSISSADLVSKWMGESEKLVRTLFEMARASKPAIIFIDEVDSMCSARGESGESEPTRRIKTEFLVQMEGCGKSGDNVLVLGATNTPWDLDQAIRRRFEKRIYIALPDASGRRRLLQLCIGDTPNELTEDDITSIAERAEGFSGADVSILVRDAIFEPIRRCQRAKCFQQVVRPGLDGDLKKYWKPCSPGAPGAVEMTLRQVKPDELIEPDVLVSDFEAALAKCRPSVAPEDLKRYEEWTAKFGSEAD